MDTRPAAGPSPFSPRDRVLACERCGAPVAMPLDGGTVACPACATPLTAPARPDTAVPPTPPGDEAARLARLRLQAGRPLVPAPGVESLMAGGLLQPARVGEARTVWGQTRRRLLLDPSDLGAAERLMSLTVALANAASGSEEDALLRAVHEGALEVVTLPRHRQVLRAALARRAAHAGDLTSAEAWLSGCDPRGEDLLADSAYRLAHAVGAIERQDWPGLERSLVLEDDAVPMHLALAPMAALLRAHARERQGDLPGATALLSACAANLPGGLPALQAVAAAMPERWCVAAAALAKAAPAPDRPGLLSGADGTTRWGWVLGGLGLGVTVLVLLPAWWAWQHGDASTEEVAVGALVTVLVVAPFTRMALEWARKGRRERRIATEGLAGTALILGISHSGTTIDEVPVLDVDVQATLPGHPPVRARLKHHALPGDLQVGGLVRVLWHPSYPDQVVLERR